MLSVAPIFHSNALSQNKIYLDFNGQVVTDPRWTMENGYLPIHAPVYNLPGDSDYDAAGNAHPFSQQELNYIEMAWKYIAEDFAPFNVDVTTEEPPLDYFTKTASNGGRAMRVLFTSRYDDARIGGTGSQWVDSDQWSGLGDYFAWSIQNIDRPVWVFANGFNTVTWVHPDTAGPWGPIQDYMGMIGSHEAGHGFGLHHDGTSASEYYAGRPGAGDTSWGVIMGGSELRTLTQWSKGEYIGAVNSAGFQEDDLAMIANAIGVGYRVDDHGNSLNTSGSTLLAVSNGNFSGSGIIGGSTETSNGDDVDVFRFDAGSQPVDIWLNVKPAAVGPNLDLELKIYNSSGTLVATINDPERIDATHHFTGSGVYYLQIDGVGKGDPLLDGYSDYGSLGQYTVLGAIGIPRVTNVTISGSSSTHTFSFDGLNDATDADGSGVQLVTVPVGFANTVEITFSEDVQASILSSHLTIKGLRYNSSPTLATDGFSYISATRTAKWRYNSVFAADQFLLSLSDLVTDAQGVALDGEWINPKFLTTTSTAVSRFPSGNGLAGGKFNFVFTNLPGDASLDNLVNSIDSQIYNTYLNIVMQNALFTQGDFNGSGAVTTADSSAITFNWLKNLTGLASADWNYDGVVDAADWVVWKKFENLTVTPWTLGDATGDGLVNGSDYYIWYRQLGTQLWLAV
jgi:hypothetical protein